MLGHHRRQCLLPNPRLEGYGLVRVAGPSRRRIYNIRAAWAEAEVFVVQQLRMGIHPGLLEREIDAELLMIDRTGYRSECLRCAWRILTNLRNTGQFDGLPTVRQFEQIRLLRPGRASYEIMMYDRFRNFDIVTRYGGDIDMARDIARARALDRDAEEELRRMREADRAHLEQQYRGNEEILLAELQMARTRAEAAETRLQFEQQRRHMARMPAAGYDQAPPAAPPYAAAPRPQTYYAAAMNVLNQDVRYPRSQMPYAAQDDFQAQRPNHPNQYRQQGDDYQRQNSMAGSEYTSTVYSDDSYYRRRQ